MLGLRAMRLEDGNEYAEGNYKFGEWFAKRVNDLLAEAGVDKSEVPFYIPLPLHRRSLHVLLVL